MKRSESLPTMDKCIKGRVYKIKSRNIDVGVWDGKKGFIGIRTKFGHRYLCIEYHWDDGAPFGTVRDAKDLGIDIPDDVPIRTCSETYDKKTDRFVNFDTPIASGGSGKGWYFIDTGESDGEIQPISKHNSELFDVLEEIERGVG